MDRERERVCLSSEHDKPLETRGESRSTGWANLDLEDDFHDAPLGCGVDAGGREVHEGDGGEVARPRVVHSVVNIHHTVNGIAERPPLLEHQLSEGKARASRDGEALHARAQVQHLHVGGLSVLLLVLLLKQPEDQRVRLLAVFVELQPQIY